ncbi:hypothetical protein [Gracilibacillus salinarum]|uniref:Uncharacterized protein n=1 Tax=Gracilibacillus salinarum TaxID=2932255 RepID=A0ABY4GHD5_9BACI|nr:hypothetical protein [Gracilibacillus salinarum]UOQ83598.1 hypothetical protein MUN87_12615 [Gracilibacillus salinarum]
MKRSKIISSIGIAFVSLTLFSTGVSADTNENEKLTEEHQINWETEWNSKGDLDSSIEFGSVSGSGGQVSSRSWGSLSTGKTNTSSDYVNNTVTSTGTSKGKVLTTVTSATTSVKDVNTGVSVNGDKSTAIAKFTAESTATIPAISLNSYWGLTIHTATDSGILYEARTADSLTHL